MWARKTCALAPSSAFRAALRVVAAVWCQHRQRREAGAPPTVTNLSMSCESRGGVSEMPGLGAVLTTELCFSMSCDHDRPPGAMFYHSFGGACASNRRIDYHNEAREPLEKASRHNTNRRRNVECSLLVLRSGSALCRRFGRSRHSARTTAPKLRAYGHSFAGASGQPAF